MNFIGKYIPNTLSIARIFLSFLLVPLILNNKIPAGIIVFVMAGISDFLDGYYARKFNVTSNLGAMLDPLGDKILMTVSYFLLAYAGLIHYYVTVIVILRDVFILCVVLVCKLFDIKLKISPSMASKINTSIQLIFVLIILTCKQLSMDVPYFCEICSAIVCISTIFSGAEYAYKYYWIKGKLLR
jgi:cardiolipin synthase